MLIEIMVLNIKINLLVYMLYNSERSCSLPIRYISRMFEINRLRKISSSPASLSWDRYFDKVQHQNSTLGTSCERTFSLFRYVIGSKRSRSLKRLFVNNIYMDMLLGKQTLHNKTIHNEYCKSCKDIEKEPSLFNGCVHQSSGIQIQSTI